MKQTNESLGSVPLHDKLLEEEMGAISIRKDIKFTSELEYLMKAMNVQCPFPPILSDEEKLLFSKMILQYVDPTFDEYKMSRDWCKHVDGVNIFPKLPTHLRTHFDVWERRHNVKKLGRATEAVRLRLKELNSICSLAPPNSENVCNNDDTQCIFPKPVIPQPITAVTPRMTHDRR